MRNLQWQSNAENGGEGFVIEAEHDGYAYGKNPRTHRRRISFDARARRLRVEDRITASHQATSASIAFLMQPGIQIESGSEEEIVLSSEGRDLAQLSGAWRSSTEMLPIFRKFQQREMRSSVLISKQGRNVENTVDISAL